MPHIPFISVHIISKENTQLGELFVEGCLACLLDARYPNEIVLVDNGSSDKCFDIYETYKRRFREDADCDLKLIKSDGTNFRVLRNTCLEYTNPVTDLFHWIDSDEMYYPEDLDVLKNSYIPTIGAHTIRQLDTYFYHFMIHPFQVQINEEKVKENNDKVKDFYRIRKDNMFGYHRGVTWDKNEGEQEDVHEHVQNQRDGYWVQSQCEYLHLGYIREQWKIFLKWLHYDMIKEGHINRYKLEINDSRTPNQIVSDRGLPNASRAFPNQYAREYTHEHFNNMLGGCKNGQDWEAYLAKLNTSNFWEAWQDKRKELGNWPDTLDWAVEESVKAKWGLV